MLAPYALALVIALLVASAIPVPPAVHALVAHTKLTTAAIPVSVTFDAPAIHASVVVAAIAVPPAFPGRRAVGHRREPHETEHAAGRGLEHAATAGLTSQDTSHFIEPTIVHDVSP